MSELGTQRSPFMALPIFSTLSLKSYIFSPTPCMPSASCFHSTCYQDRHNNVMSNRKLNSRELSLQSQHNSDDGHVLMLSHLYIFFHSLLFMHDFFLRLIMRLEACSFSPKTTGNIYLCPFSKHTPP